MNPFYGSLEDVQAVPAPDRVRAIMERQEAAEVRQAEIARYEREAAAEANHMMTVVRHRRERIELGATSEELAWYAAEQKERRDARIAELNRELDRLDPGRPRVQRQGQFDIEHRIARAREVADRGNLLIARMRRQDQEERQLRRSVDSGPADCAQCRALGASRSEEMRVHAGIGH